MYYSTIITLHVVKDPSKTSGTRTVENTIVIMITMTLKGAILDFFFFFFYPIT